MGQLPVEYAAQTVGPDQEVAHPVVAVHGHPRPARWSVRREPAHAELECGTDLAQRIEDGQGVAERVSRRQANNGGRVDGVDGGQGAPGLGGQRSTGRGPFVVTQHFARDGLALEPLHHQPTGAELAAVAERHDRRHRHAGHRGGAQQRGLHPHPALLRALAAVHLHNERPCAAVGVQLEGAGDTRGTAGQAPQVARGPAECTAQPLRQLLVAQAGGHRYSTGTTGLPPSSSWCRYSQMP